MKRALFTFCTLIGLALQGLAAPAEISVAERYAPWQHSFESAYSLNPGLPRGILEAIAWTNTRMRPVEPDAELASCAGLPKFYGVMGLVVDGGGWFRENAAEVVRISRQPASLVRDNGHWQILSYAHALSEKMRTAPSQKGLDALLHALESLSEIPNTADPVNNFAYQSQLYSIARFMGDAENQRACRFPDPQIDLERLFGAENLRVLSASSVSVQGSQVRAGSNTFQASRIASVDYPPAIWTAAASCNYSGRGGVAVSAVTIHTIQGSYSSAISWFQNCAASVSAHYVVRSSDGQVTQMVLESDKAWHVGTENAYTIGIEHEGYVDDAAWYTNNLYTATTALVQDIANSGYGINLLKTWDGAPSAGIQVLSTNCYKIKGHQHYANQTHTDPGIHWDWARFYRMLNGTPTPTVLTTATGTCYDAGGAAANYSNQVRQTWKIAPTSATTVTLTFSAFDLETGYDYLYIYDGEDAEGQLIGKYDGTTLPGPITANSGKVFLEFRSDCATTRAGWAASWTSSTAAPTCGIPTALSVTNLHGFGATLGWTAGVGANSYEIRLRHSLSSAWTTYSSTGNSLYVSGLKASSEYFWQVRTLCGAASSSWEGGSFLTPVAANHTTTACSGNFRDSGGNIANYRNAEAFTFTISPPGASGVTLSFNSFSLEANYDYLYIYDGPSTASPLIGTYTGTTSPGTVNSTGGSLTVRFSSDSWTTRAGWDAIWSCTQNLAPTTAIGPLQDWYSDDFTATFSDVDHSSSGIVDAFYQVLEYTGTNWNANRGNGFLYETFDGSFPNWTQTAGNHYILNDRLHQTDTVSTNTNVHIDLAQTNSGAYLYTFSARLWSGTTNRRFGIHIFADNPTATNRGNSYLIWFRGDTQDVQIYETVSDVLNVRVTQPMPIADFIWYEYKVVYDPATGKIDVFQENDLVATWTDTTPLTAGSHVSLRTNEAHMDFESVRAWKERGGSANIKIGPASTEDCRYQSPDPTTYAGEVFSIARDGLDHWSNIDFRLFKIDWTAPSTPAVADGPAADVDTIFQDTLLQANWSAAADPHSGILYYEYAAGTTSGATNTIPWTNAGLSTSASQGGLLLTHNQRYYFSVRAYNAAGLVSQTALSNGQLVWAPVLSHAQAQSPTWYGYPNPFQGRYQLVLMENAPYEVAVMDLQGRTLFMHTYTQAGTQALALDALSSGSYLLRVRTADGQVAMERIVKQ